MNKDMRPSRTSALILCSTLSMRTARFKAPRVFRYLKDNHGKLAILDPCTTYPVRLDKTHAEVILGEGRFVYVKQSEVVVSTFSAN